MTDAECLIFNKLSIKYLCSSFKCKYNKHLHKWEFTSGAYIFGLII